MEFSFDRTVSILERTPAVLRTLLAGLDAAITQRNYGPGTWSAYEVVGHLIAGERRDWLARARTILVHGPTRPFEPFPHDSTVRPDSGPPLDDLLLEFADLRAENLRALRALRLAPDQFALRGMHPALGEVTLAQLLATWAAHDLHHLRQIAKAMAWQSRELVGPWRDHLNTLAEPPA